VHAIPSTCGGGTHGHLGLVMTTADYQTTASITFLLPAHPGDAPVVPAGADQLVANEIVCVFKAELAELTLAATLRKELKNNFSLPLTASTLLLLMMTFSDLLIPL